MKKIIILFTILAAAFIIKMPKASADLKDKCKGVSCKAGDSCYPRLGFECNSSGTGQNCSTYYNCENLE